MSKVTRQFVVNRYTKNMVLMDEVVPRGEEKMIGGLYVSKKIVGKAAVIEVTVDSDPDKVRMMEMFETDETSNAAMIRQGGR